MIVVRNIVILALGVTMVLIANSGSAFADQPAEPTFLLPACPVEELVCVDLMIRPPCDEESAACAFSKDHGLRAPSPYEDVIVFTAHVEDTDYGVRAAQMKAYAAGDPCGAAMFLALKTVTEAGHPILMAESGQVELLSNSARNLAWSKLVLDADTGTILNRYLVPSDTPGAWRFHFMPDGRVFMRSFDGPCLTAIARNSGTLALGTSKYCPRAATSDTGLEHATEAEIALAAMALPERSAYYEDQFGSRVYRVSGRRELMVDLVDACT